MCWLLSIAIASANQDTHGIATARVPIKIHKDSLGTLPKGRPQISGKWRKIFVCSILPLLSLEEAQVVYRYLLPLPF